MSISNRFMGQCHSLYDRLHGERKISQLFDNISDRQVEELINIYRVDVLKRWYNIENYLKNENINYERATSFYLNALQHFME